MDGDVMRRLAPPLRAVAGLALVVAAGAPALAIRDVDWRRIATPADRDRLRGWRSAWVSALEIARAGGGGPAIAQGGVLFDPDRAVIGARPPAGDYRCRVYKLGGKGPLVPAFAELPPATCRIAADGDQLSLYRVGGAQRPFGVLFSDTDARLVFLGTMALGDEKRAMQYGRDQRRDMAGILERIGPKRWRLVLPYPRFETTLDVVELEPIG